MWIYAALWFGVGFLQGGGWPGCANIMRHVSQKYITSGHRSFKVYQVDLSPERIIKLVCKARESAVLGFWRTSVGTIV